jgi:DNA repair protein SbcC/Rad50
MKILKIELQNINSLKSETPIVIDFTGELFRDVGLFVITGSTGAGKTTILDAITIAMYHEVPRFNKPNIKATLEDVVSYGADGAMARVTFETKGEKYESQWNIRLTSSNGKRLTNPKEEVRLKNLTTGTIVAEKKREVETEIERITQLSYSQFLRSVLLAQGEFAAFLSADAKDKGTLLEQITGEEIYKKIGETLSDKIYEERKELDRIKAKINTEDLLSEEKRKELIEEELLLNGKLKTLDLELKSIEEAINWFKKSAELIINQQQLEKDREELDRNRETNQPIMKALELHEKAEPFKEAVDELSRIEKELQKKKERSEELLAELVAINKTLEEVKTGEEKQKKSLTGNENELKQWLPKLEQVTKLDTEIINVRNNTTTTNKTISDLAVAIGRIEESSKQKTEQSKQREIARTAIESYLQQNSSTQEIEKRFSLWNSKLTLRKSNLDRISELSGNIHQTEKEFNFTKIELENKEQLFALENSKLEQIKIEVSEIAGLLALNNLEELLVKQKQQENRRNQLKDLQTFSTSFNDLNRALSQFNKEKENLEGMQKTLAESITVLQIKIAAAETSLHDAETILEQERTIKSFEEERQKLEMDKPCPLCGSTHHPFIEKYDSIELSKTQTEVDNRKIILENLKSEEKNIEIKLAGVKTKLESISLQIQNIQQQQEEAHHKFTAYPLEFKIEDTLTIEKTTIALEKELNFLSEKIFGTQQIQKQKDGKEQLLNSEREKANTLKTEIAKLQEKCKGFEESVTQKKIEENTIRIETETKETELEKELSGFGLLLPASENTNQFIQQLESKIALFNAKSKELVEVRNAISSLGLELKNNEDQQKEKFAEKTKLLVELKKLDEELMRLSGERNLILPLEIATETKRGELQKGVEKAKNDFDIITNELNGLITLQATRAKEQENNEKEKVEYQTNLAAKTSTLDEVIHQSIFESRQEVENALLSADNKTTYSAIRKQLEDKALTLKTLDAKLKEDIGTLEKEKTFELSFETAQENHTKIELARKQLHERTGEIKKQFELDDQIKDRNKGVVEEINNQEKVLKKWTDLLTLLGGSKHAFNTYVQRLTLQNLINLANIHLFKLNRRYSLMMAETYKAGEELNFMLVDHYQTDEARLVDTSSGGEKFLISLALALGLSDLASNNVTIGSLFIDEGFGTLDNNTLETVISTLETLHAQGKMIGIISHVENLKERIPAQIQVLKKSNGVSEVIIV